MELNFLPNNFYLKDNSTNEHLVKTDSLQLSHAEKSVSKDTELQLRTKDGDIVTLTASTDFETKFDTYSAFKKTGNSTTSLKGFSQSMEYRSSYEISMEGNFSREEIRDINKAIKKLEKAMKNLSQGDIEKAVKNTASLAELDTIGDFQASLTYNDSSEYEYFEKSNIQQTEGRRQMQPELPEKSRSILQKITDELAETAKTTKIPRGKIASPVNRLFQDMRDQTSKASREKTNPWNNLLDDLQKSFSRNLFAGA